MVVFGNLFSGLVSGFKTFLEVPRLFGTEAERAAWAFLTPMEKALVVMKALAGAAMVVGGTIGAISIAKDAGQNWQDLSVSMKAVHVAGTGLMAGMAGLGAVMLGASGPVGWAIAGAVALTSFCVGMAQTQDGIGSVKKETENLAKAQENAKIANDNYLTAMDNLSMTMSNLEQLEKQTGLSGAELDEQVKNGTLEVDKMTAAQISVYNAYLQNEEMLKQAKATIEAKTKADKEQTLSTLKLEAANAIASDSYDTLLDSVTKAMDEGSISAQEGADIMSRALANASDTIQNEYRNKLPDAMKECFNPDKYESEWRKFGTTLKNWAQGLRDWWDKLWRKETPTPSSPSGSGGGFSSGGRRWRPEVAVVLGLFL